MYTLDGIIYSNIIIGHLSKVVLSNHKQQTYDSQTSQQYSQLFGQKTTDGLQHYYTPSGAKVMLARWVIALPI